jgi:hypothetical protein
LTNIHLSPLWKAKADSKIFADISENLDNSESEEIWARKLKENEYEICCIPFFIYGFAIGDIVQVDSEKKIVGLLKRSGRSTVRVWFKEANRDIGPNLSSYLKSKGIGVPKICSL